MKNRLLVILTAAALVAPVASQAALLTTVLSGVVIGADVYNVTFTQDEDGWTTFNQVFGAGDPVLTFMTEGDAMAAATAVGYAADAADAGNFHSSPANDFKGFYIPFTYDQTSVTDVPLIYGFGLAVLFPTYTYDRDQVQPAAYATFELVREASAPATLALLGIGLAGLGISRRRK